jgi:hypothetical protein
LSESDPGRATSGSLCSQRAAWERCAVRSQHRRPTSWWSSLTGSDTSSTQRRPGARAQIVHDQVHQVVPCADPPLVLLVRFTAVVALGPSGVEWATPRLCVAGLEVLNADRRGMVCSCDNPGGTPTLTLDPVTSANRQAAPKVDQAPRGCAGKPCPHGQPPALTANDRETAGMLGRSGTGVARALHPEAWPRGSMRLSADGCAGEPEVANGLDHRGRRATWGRRGVQRNTQLQMVAMLGGRGGGIRWPPS